MDNIYIGTIKKCTGYRKVNNECNYYCPDFKKNAILYKVDDDHYIDVDNLKFFQKIYYKKYGVTNIKNCYLYKTSPVSLNQCFVDVNSLVPYIKREKHK